MRTYSHTRPTNMGLALNAAAFSAIKAAIQSGVVTGPKAAMSSPAVPWVARRLGLQESKEGLVRETDRVNMSLTGEGPRRWAKMIGE
jgi:hypothetical protein